MNPLSIVDRNPQEAGLRRCARAVVVLSFLGLAVWSTAPALAGQPVAGAMIGGGAGALVGQAIGGRDGAIVGAAVGAAAGAVSASRIGGAHGASIQVGAGYAPPVGVVYPAPVYGGVYGSAYGVQGPVYGPVHVYGPVPPLYAPVAPVFVVPPVVYRPPILYAPPVIPAVRHRAPVIVYDVHKVKRAKPPHAAYRTGSRPPHAGPAGGGRGHGHGRKHR